MAKKKDCKFTQGYICAVTSLINGHGHGTEVDDLMAGICKDENELRLRGVDEYDIEILKRHNLLTP